MKKRNIMKLFAVILCLAMMMSTLAACGSADVADDAGEDEIVRDTIVVASQTEPTSLGTTYHNALASDYVNQLIYAGLVRVNEKNEVVGDVAESWEQPSDTEWIFHLREDVYFHNGEKLTSADVVATLYWAQGFEPVASFALSADTIIEAVDEYTVRIVTAAPEAALPYKLSNHTNFIVPKSLIDSENDFNTNPVGCGPYKFVSWDASEKLTFEAFDQFYEGAPAIKNLIYMVMPESSARTVALQSGDVDYVIQVNSADYELLAADENVELLELASCTLNYIMVNNAAAPFDNEDFRKAVNAAIDKQAVVDAALYGLGTPTSVQTPENLPGSVNTNADGYDPELAKQYLAASGLSGDAASFTILCSNDTKVKVAEIIQSYLSEVGITMEIESCDTAAYLSNTASGDYQAAIGGYSHSSMYTFANYCYLSSSMGGTPRSQAGYDDVDALLAKAGALVDNTAHVAALEELSAVLNDHCISIPLYLDTCMRAYNADLGGVIINSANENNWRTMYWEN